MASAIKPVGAEAKTRGTPIKLLKRAYCVAVNFLFVRLAIKATKAEVPNPALKFSKATTAAKAGMLCPIYESTANPAVETAWRNPKTQRERLIPYRRIKIPPARDPKMVAQNPKSFTTDPISVFEKLISK